MPDYNLDTSDNLSRQEKIEKLASIIDKIGHLHDLQLLIVGRYEQNNTHQLSNIKFVVDQSVLALVDLGELNEVLSLQILSRCIWSLENIHFQIEAMWARFTTNQSTETDLILIDQLTSEIEKQLWFLISFFTKPMNKND